MTDVDDKRSLAKQFPRRYDVPVMIAVATVALAVAYALPVMVISKFWFFSDDYTLFGSVIGMWEEEFYVLAALIFAFSVVFPLSKLLALLLVWYRPFTDSRRTRVLHWLGVLGKWSMLDVFVVAMIVVLTQSKGLLGAEPREGLYVFSGAILLSMIVTVVVERLARRAAE
jgi:paraquat-inducible protein A